MSDEFKHMSGVLLLLFVCILPSMAIHDDSKNCSKTWPMSSCWDNSSGTLIINRENQTIVVYERDTRNGRSIANAITQVYAIGHPNDNLVNNSSAIVPPQILILRNKCCVNETCYNDQKNIYCDYFTHHSPKVNILHAGGENVTFEVNADATQHNNMGKPISYTSDMTIRVPYEKNYTIIKYDVNTSLNKKLLLGFSIRPLPFYEVVNRSHENLSYINSSCRVNTTSVPKTIEASGIGEDFVKKVEVCQNGTYPWAAMYNNNNTGNLGMILESWMFYNRSIPVFSSYIERKNNLTNESTRRPNMLFEPNDSQSYNNSILDRANWSGEVIFIAYTEPGYETVKEYAESEFNNKTN